MNWLKSVQRRLENTLSFSSQLVLTVACSLLEEILVLDYICFKSFKCIIAKMNKNEESDLMQFILLLLFMS